MFAFRPTAWPRTAAGCRYAARVDSLDIVLVGTVIILIGLDVQSRANGRAMSERASADQGDAYDVSGDRHHASHAASPCKSQHTESTQSPDPMSTYARGHGSA